MSYPAIIPQANNQEVSKQCVTRTWKRVHNAGDEAGLALTGETIIGKDNYVTQSVGNELRISSATRSRLPGVSVTSGGVSGRIWQARRSTPVLIAPRAVC